MKLFPDHENQYHMYENFVCIIIKYISQKSMHINILKKEKEKQKLLELILFGYDFYIILYIANVKKCRNLVSQKCT